MFFQIYGLETGRFVWKRYLAMVCTRTLYSVMKAYRMNLISAGRISVDSTFKYLSEIHNKMLENHLLLLAGPSHVTVSLSGDNCMKIKDIPGGKEGFLLSPKQQFLPKKETTKSGKGVWQLGPLRFFAF